MRARSVALAALLLTAGCGEKLTEIVVAIDDTTTESIDLPAGAYHFPVEVGEIEYDGNLGIRIGVEAVRAGEVVERMSCVGYTINGSPSGGWKNHGGTQHAASCVLEVPDGGADTLRVTPRFDRGHAEIEEMRVHVRTGSGSPADLFGD